MDEQPENKLLKLTEELAKSGATPAGGGAAKILASGFGLPQTPKPIAASAPAPAPAPEPPTYSAEEMLNRLMESPLYEPIVLHGKPHDVQIADLRKLETRYDRYCPSCKKETSWSTEVTHGIKQRYDADWLGPFALMSTCGRCGLIATMNIRAAATGEKDRNHNTLAALTKYGEWPALVAFHQNDLEQYRKVTTREQRSDFVRAVQAASQGFAAGACTYLRRVLESIKREALEDKRKAGADSEWEAEYSKAKTNRQMELLKGFLPDFLLKNKRLYNLLSEGLHNMTDDECRELFPSLRQAIELVFKGRQDLLTAREREAEISKFIAQNDPGRP